jgi:acyl carrier protein
MEKKEIEQKVIEIVAVQFGRKLDSVELETKFLTDLQADSLDTVEIIMVVEDMFNIDVPDEDAEKLMTVGAVADYLEKRRADESSK